MPRFHYRTQKIIDDFSRKLDAIEKHWPDAKVNKQDGLRLDWADRWIHVRSSNTEPVVRIIAEAPTAEEAKALCDAAAVFCG